MIITIKPKYNMSFDEFKLILTGLSNAYGKPGRFGCFYVAIDNNSHFYFFEKLKMSQTMNNDICGLSLNHYGWQPLAKQQYKRSKFHDEEDVSIDFERAEFIDAERTGSHLNVKTKTFTATILWAKN
jgi:hypothetical protein